MNVRERVLSTSIPHNGPVFEINGEWFYVTCEGTTEGPFSTQHEAQSSLEGYARIAASRLFDQASRVRINNLSLVEN